MKKVYLLTISLLITTAFVYAQGNTVKKIPQDLFFMIGNWEGEGQFASGKKIEATITIKLTLDSCWLNMEHADKLPNRYKAQTLCGVDRSTGQFIAYTFDNFSGHRIFSSEGWKDNKLIFNLNENTQGNGITYQHFIYEKISESSFKMSYELSKDGQNWRLVDFLIFKRS